MKFSEVQRMLLDGFGDTITPRDVKKALDIAFPGFCIYRSDRPMCIYSRSHSLASSMTFTIARVNRNA